LPQPNRSLERWKNARTSPVKLDPVDAGQTATGLRDEKTPAAQSRKGAWFSNRNHSRFADCQSTFRVVCSPDLILEIHFSEEGKMKYRVHQLEVKRGTAQEKLQNYLNQLDGEIVAVIPYVSPTFQLMGATSKVDFLLIVEKSEV
jgi:hypothetical protein